LALMMAKVWPGREVGGGIITSSRQLGTATKLPILGEVPMWRPVRDQSVAVEDRSSPERVEAFRRLRARMMHGDPLDVPASVVIVSAQPAEGRSSTACDLGMAIAAGGSSVMLVDANLRPSSSPGIAEYFGIHDDKGLFDIVTNDSPSAQVIWSCHSMLSVLPRGSTSIKEHLDAMSGSGRDTNPRLESSDLRKLLKELEAQCDVVIIDTPPLLASADGLILAGLASSVVLVVRRGRTALEDVRRVADDLRSVGARMGGILVTHR
jgi:Mrp family chromosome partitioning ATPase